jgi:transcriptional regulator GlxA family with amidase domain
LTEKIRSNNSAGAVYPTVNHNNQPLIVGILIFDEVEVLDVTGPFEVFSATRLNEERRFSEPSPFRILLVSENPNPIFATGGLRLTPDITFDHNVKLDLLVVPGGKGTRMEIGNAKLIDWISKQASETPLTASVCTGSCLLGKAGLLDGRIATTHWKAFDFLRLSAPKARILTDVQFTMAEPIFTSAGVASGIDLSLRIVSYFFGTEIGQSTARYMQYPYPTSDMIGKN